MSLQPELEKLVEYLAPLAGGAESGGDTPHEVTAKDWDTLSDGIERASAKILVAADHLRDAITELPAKAQQLSVLGESLLDQAVDADDLVRMALVLKQRAHPERALSATELAQLEAATADAKAAKAELKLADQAAAMAAAITTALRRDDARAHVAQLLEELTAARDDAVAAASGKASSAAEAKKAAQAARSEAARAKTFERLESQAAAASSEPAAPGDPVESVGDGGPTELDDSFESTELGEPGAADDDPTDTSAVTEAPTLQQVTQATKKVDEVLARLVTVVERTLRDVSKESTTVPAASKPQTNLDKAAAALKSGQGSLETARGHLGDTGNLQPSAQSFLDDLDLLTVRVLDTRRSLDRLNHG